MLTMKKHLPILLWTVLCLIASPAVKAQTYTPVPVQVSQEKVRLNGKVYYSHPVLDRQTLFGIAKAYGVTVDDLYAANPGLKETGLKKDTIILVPTASGQQEAATSEAPSRETQPQAPTFIQHTVMWYEDLDDIATQYGVTPQEIMEANGMRSKKVTTRQVLKIPVKGTGAQLAQVQDKAAPVREETKPVDPPVIPKIADPVIADPDITSPTDFTPVTVDKIRVEKAKAKEVLPPDLPELADPVIADPEVTDPGQLVPIEVDPMTVDPAKALETEGTEEPAEGIFDWFKGRGTVEMALVLPFNSIGSTSETNMDFYAGVLLALRDLEAEGIKGTLNVYDLQAGAPSGLELAKNDFILGPISTNDLTSILETTGGKVPIVSPLDQRAASLANSYRGFIQAPSALDNQYTELAAWIAADTKRGDKVILLSEKTPGGANAAATGIRNALIDQGVSFETLSLTQAEGRSSSHLSAMMGKTGTSRVIVASEREAFVVDAIRNISNLRGQGYNAVMYALSKVRTFDTVDGMLMHQDNLHIVSAYYIDYDNPKVKAFASAFRALYKAEPSQFAFQGYDTARYFATMVAKYGNQWTKALLREEGQGLHTDFHFEQTAYGAYRNTAIRRIVYNKDFTTELAR
jgi:LysM repeat protein/ABC-type branched-subunit amino acid transport system substrate-binding protein